jgi:hypothetical protein
MTLLMKYILPTLVLVVLLGLGYWAVAANGGKISHPGNNQAENQNMAPIQTGDTITQAGYTTYKNSQFGFSFDYTVQAPATFSCSPDSDPDTVDQFLCSTGVDGTDSPGNIGFLIMKDKDLAGAIQRIKLGMDEAKQESDEDYTMTTKTVNGIQVTIFRYHTSFADSNIELRLGKLANGFVFEAFSDGPFKASPDMKFLDSIRNL